MPHEEKEKRAAGWAQDVKTAVEVPTSRSQQRLKAIAKPGGGWDEEVHTVARAADAILPAAAFRASLTPVSVPERAPPSRVVPPPLPLVATVPALPLSRAETAAAGPSYEAQPGDSAALQLEEPSPPAAPRSGHWALLCLGVCVCGALGYAAVTFGLAP